MPPKIKPKQKKGTGPKLDKVKDSIGSVISKALKAYFTRTKGKGKRK